ncbi:MAG: alginate export family protein, partial [Candidatus Eisenbacteria bacterium]|nr:alginate export family protein [Candidatus Eisenbacteria bacterium]
MMGVRPPVFVLAFVLLGSCLSLAVSLPARGEGEKLAFGGEIRFRGEGFDNLLDLDDSREARDDYEYYRLRARLQVDAQPRDRLRLFFRLGNEYRFGRGVTNAGVRDSESKISLDNGWVEIGAPPETHLSLRLGRQDLAYGEGFLIFDGTPADGSSSAWFDALLASYRPSGWSIDLFEAKIDDEGFGAETREEDLYGLYARRAPFDVYALHRKQERAVATRAGIVHPPQRTTAPVSYTHLRA